MSTKYLKLYNNLVNKIESKEYKIGSKLPSENELTNNFGYSRDTIRKALSLLEQNGYISKSKGKASIVINKSQFHFPISKIVSFKELNSNISNKTIVMDLKIAHDDKNIQDKLELNEDEKYFKLVRIREIEGEKIIIDKDYIPKKYVNELPLEEAKNSLYEYFEKKLGLKISYSKKEITVKFISDEDKTLLDLKNFEMIVVVKSYTYLEGDQLFQYTESRHRPDKFKFIDFAYRKNI